MSAVQDVQVDQIPVHLRYGFSRLSHHLTAQLRQMRLDVASSHAFSVAC